MRKWMLLMLLLLLPAVMTEARADLPGAPMIMLKGNPTTGYSWSWEIDEERVVDVGAEYAADWQFRQEGEPVLTGTGGRYLFILTGLNPGEVTITFTYKRPWEENALYTLVYHVRVDEELNVTILGSSFDW